MQSVTFQKIYLCAFALFFSLSAFAQPANSLSFDGSSDRIQMSGLNLTGPLTISAWVKPNPRTDFSTIISNKYGGGQNPGFQFGINTYQQNDRLLHFESQNAVAASTVPVTWGVWQQVTVTYNGSQAAFYINGVNAGLGAGSSVNLNPSSYATFIGDFYAYFAGGKFNGEMDDLQIWNSALSQTQIQALLCTDLDGTEPGLIAYFDFDQGTAAGVNGTETNLIDRTGNGNNGTLSTFTLSGGISNWVDGANDFVGLCSCTAPAPEIASDDLNGDPILLDISTGNTVTINGSFTAGCGNHTIEVNWDDPNNPGVVNANVDETAKTYNSSNTFTQTGVYMVEITITDEESQSTSYLGSVPILVYDFRCGTGRLNATYFDPTDGLKTIIGTEAKYNSSTGFTGFSDFEFIRKSGSTVVSRFEETNIAALVISGNTATITGEGRFEVGGTFSGPATHDFSVTFQEVATQNLQVLTISEKGTGAIAYNLDAPVDVRADRVKVINTGGCRFAEQELIEAVSVFPNPFSQSFVVEFPEAPLAAIELRVLNAMGQEVYQTVSDQLKAKISLNHVASGIYFLQVRQGANVTTTKLVKE